VIWESGIDLARLVECLYLFRRERHVEARKIILQLRKLSCPDDGDDRHWAVAEPCQRDFRHSAAGLIRYRFDGRDDSAGSLLLGHEIPIRHHRVAVQAALLGRAVAVVLAVRMPLPRGDHAVKLRFRALAIGTDSRSTLRSIRLYSICKPTKGDHPRSWTSIFAWAIHHGGAVGIREENDAIELEDVEGVREFFQRGIDIGQGEAGETSEPVWPRMNELGREFIAAPRQSTRLGAISRVYAGRTQRDDGNVDAGVIHERDTRFPGPAKRRKSTDGSSRVLRRLPKNVWQDVVMGVDGQ